MEHTQHFGEIAILLAVAVTAVVLLRFLRFPSIIGFLLTGMAIGPMGLGVIPAEHVGQFAEIGLVLLLFTVGLELSPAPLLRAGRRLILAVALQFLLVGVCTAVVLTLTGNEGLRARLILGIAVTLSSTAIVLKSISDRNETGTVVGNLTTGVLLLQDVAVIVFMLTLPVIAGGGSGGLLSLVMAEGVRLVILAVIVVAAHFLLPRILDLVTRQGGRELTTLFAVLMAAAGAWLASLAGWSPGLGACTAGLLLANADQRHQLVAEVTPFRDVFNAVFFVALGMLVDFQAVIDHPWSMAGAIIATIVVKSTLTGVAVRCAGWPWRVGLAAGLSLATVSEFAFVLASEATGYGLLSPAVLNVLIVYTVGCMIVGTFILPAAAPLAEWLTGRERNDNGGDAGETGTHPLHHVIVVGYGVTGANLAKVLKATRVPFRIIEMSPARARQAQADGHEVILGDAARMAILSHAGIHEARALVVAINEPRAAEHIVAQASALYPNLFILVRVRFVSNLEHLYRRGAKLVVPEEFETSIEIAAHVLKEFRIPANVIEAQVTSLRAGGYGLLRGKPADRAMATELMRVFEQTITETFYLTEESRVCGQTIAESGLRAQTGASIIAIVRGGRATPTPPPDHVLEPGDVLILVGAHAQLDTARLYLQGHDWRAPGA